MEPATNPESKPKREPPSRTTSRPSERIIYTEEDVGQQRTSVLLYGPLKSGKTRFAATAPTPWFFDFDNGLKSARVPGRKLRSVRPATWQDILFWLIELKSGRQPAQTVIIDSLTTAYREIMKGVLKLAGRETPAQADWGMANDRVRQVIEDLISCQKFDVVLVAHDATDKDEVTGAIIGGLFATPQLRSAIPPLFDDVFYMRAKYVPQQGMLVRKRVEELYAVPFDRFNAGARTQGVKDVYTNPTWAMVYGKGAEHGATDSSEGGRGEGAAATGGGAVPPEAESVGGGDEQAEQQARD